LLVEGIQGNGRSINGQKDDLGIGFCLSTEVDSSVNGRIFQAIKPEPYLAQVGLIFIRYDREQSDHRDDKQRHDHEMNDATPL
jgi:hypothetical protein